MIISKPTSSAGVPVPEGYLSYEAFLEWADEDTLAEWVDGKVEMSSPASARHQLLKVFLVGLLGLYVEWRGLGIVLDAPFQMRLPGSGREPDVLFVREDRRRQVRDTFLDGPADLVIEIISPESVQRDRVRKFAEYQHGGVGEYWLIDPSAQTAGFYQLDAHGIYQQVPEDANGHYAPPAVAGFWIDVNWLWREPLPGIEDSMLAIGGQAYLRHVIARAGRQGIGP